MSLTGKNVLMIVASRNFRDEELKEPKRVLEKNGASVTIASKGTEIATGMLNAEIKVDRDIREIDLDRYQVVVFVGGTGASTYFNDRDALRLAEEAYEKEKVIGAICIAPSILANAGLLKNKEVTAYHSREDHLKGKGAHYTGRDVEKDGRIITGKGPKVANEFGRELVKSLRK